MKKSLYNKGFSLYEMIAVVAITLVIMTGFAYNYQKFLDQQVLNKDLEDVVSMIRSAHTQTVSSYGGAAGTDVRRYGIYFGDKNSAPPNYVALFYGDSYTTPGAITKELYLNPTVEIVSATLPSSSVSTRTNDNLKTAFFELISGNIVVKHDNNTFAPLGAAGGVIVLRSKPQNIQRTITLLSTGLIKVSN